MFPSEGQTLAVVPTNNAIFEQILQFSIVDGYTCPGNMTIALALYVDGVTEAVGPEAFALPTSGYDITGHYDGVTSGLITPQTLTMVASVTNPVAETSIDLTY
jgi:hypothetical protein